MVHTGLSTYAGLTRAMFFRDKDKGTNGKEKKQQGGQTGGFTPKSTVSPLGIPKSPSFHSGLDLVASDQDNKRSETIADFARSFRFASYGLNCEDSIVKKEVSPVMNGVPQVQLQPQQVPQIAMTNGGRQQGAGGNGGPGTGPALNATQELYMRTRDRNFYHTNVQDLVQLPYLRGNRNIYF